MDLEAIIRNNAGPPVNIEAIIRAMGVELEKHADLDEGISGQLEHLGNGRYKISTNKTDHYYRKRFTMAHELGHFLYHSHLIGEGVDDNTAYRSVPDGRYFNQAIGQREETEANKFAAQLLMPSDAVRQVWTETSDLSQTATAFKVSKQAMRIRLEGLGFTPM